MYSFKNLKRPVNIGSGITEFLLFAPVEWFTSIKEPTAPFLVPGAEISILDDHTFSGDKGFLVASLAPEKNQLTAKTINEKPSQTFEQQLQIFIPGSYAILHETLKNLLNTPLIVLVKDSNCASPLFYQLGSSCRPAYLTGDFSTGTTKDGVKGYAVTISFISPYIQLYQGLIKKYNPAIQSSPVFLAQSDIHNISGDANALANYFSTAASKNITEIYNQIIANAGSSIIQISFATNQDQHISDYLIPVDLASEETFTNSLIVWLAENGSGQQLVPNGSSLSFIDPNTTIAYFGISIPINILGFNDDENDFVLSDGEQILITS